MNKLIILAVLCSTLLGLGLKPNMADVICDGSACLAHVPGSISPNGDGINDFFFIEAGCHWSTYNLKIKDSSDKLVFETDDLSETWDGTFKGKPLPQGFYNWELYFVQKESGNRIQENGQFVLVR